MTTEATSPLSLDELFMDSSEMTVDAKGRVAIPEKFMKVLRKVCPDSAGSIAVAPTPERSIRLMPVPYFLGKAEKWTELDGWRPEHRTLLNFLTSLSGIFALDAQNRVKLNPALMRLCNIQRDVIIVGNLKYMQMFDRRTFDKMIEDGLEKFDAAYAQSEKVDVAPAPVQYVFPTARTPMSEPQSS